MAMTDSPKNDLQVFCDNIVYLRKKHQISVTTMARRLHITPKTLKTIESGEMPKCVTIKILLYICEMYRYRPNELFLPMYGEK